MQGNAIYYSPVKGKGKSGRFSKAKDIAASAIPVYNIMHPLKLEKGAYLARGERIGWAQMLKKRIETIVEVGGSYSILPVGWYITKDLPLPPAENAILNTVLTGVSIGLAGAMSYFASSDARKDEYLRQL